MTHADILENMCVADVKRFLVKNPLVIDSSQSLEALAAKLIEEPRSRYVYVLDKNDKLIGSVRMNAIIQYLFPFTAISEHGTEVTVNQFSGMTAATVADVMNDDPFYVKESTKLSEAAKILMREKINELPVLDNDHRIIGQLNVFEIITEYLKSVA